MTNAELLSMSTIYIECDLIDGTVSRGTGFYFVFNKTQETLEDIVIVTNKHVVKNSKRLMLKFFPCVENKPDYTNHFDHIFNIKESDWLYHPDNEVDLCMLPFEELINEVEDIYGDIFLFPYDKSQIPSTKDIEELRVIEDILMLGYPLGLYDHENNVPFIRRGITAMHPKFDFDGVEEFYIDAAILPGSSGSPVIIYNEGGFINKNGDLDMNKRLWLLGILYAEPAYELEGIKGKRKIACKMAEIIVKEIPTNLGIVIKSKKILEMEYLLGNAK